MSSLTIVTPVYNEEAIVQESINETYNSAKQFFNDIQYIIVNDGSTDSTSEALLPFHGKENFTIINKNNGGFGSAISTGIKYAEKDWIICIPADSPLDIYTANSFFNNTENASIIIGYRKERKGYSLRMKLNSIVFHQVVSGLFKIKLRDYNWIHLYKREIFNNIEIKSEGLFMLAEVLIKAKNNNIEIFEVEVEQKQRLTGIATASKFSAILQTLREIIQLKRTL